MFSAIIHITKTTLTPYVLLSVLAFLYSAFATLPHFINHVRFTERNHFNHKNDKTLDSKYYKLGMKGLSWGLIVAFLAILLGIFIVGDSILTKGYIQVESDKQKSHYSLPYRPSEK